MEISKQKYLQKLYKSHTDCKLVMQLVSLIRGLESELPQLFCNPNQDNTEQGLYFTGYVVDDHAIRMPAIEN
jgi:hypothetical protein